MTTNPASAKPSRSHRPSARTVKAVGAVGLLTPMLAVAPQALGIIGSPLAGATTYNGYNGNASISMTSNDGGSDISIYANQPLSGYTNYQHIELLKKNSSGGWTEIDNCGGHSNGVPGTSCPDEKEVAGTWLSILWASEDGTNYYNMVQVSGAF